MLVFGSSKSEVGGFVVEKVAYRSDHQTILPVPSVGAGLVEEIVVPGTDGGGEEDPTDEGEEDAQAAEDEGVVVFRIGLAEPTADFRDGKHRGGRYEFSFAEGGGKVDVTEWRSTHTDFVRRTKIKRKTENRNWKFKERKEIDFLRKSCLITALVPDA